MDERFLAGCEIIYQKCMGLKPGETVAVVTDDVKLRLGEALYEAAKRFGAKPVLIRMPTGTISGEEPPRSVAEAMRASDVVVCPTEHSITHTNARIEAVKAGARVATMPGITEEMFSQGPITADYGEVARLTAIYAELLTRAETARIVTGDGCELTVNLAGRRGVMSSGVYREKGQSGNLPSGEAYIAPVEDGANGRYAVTGSAVGVGRMAERAILTLRDGVIASVEGPGAAALDKAIPKDRLARTIGELGIGTNPAARVTGNILEDEKIYASVHVAFGTNTSFGGRIKAGSHIDCVTLAPEIWLDGRLVASGGRLLAEASWIS